MRENLQLIYDMALVFYNAHVPHEKRMEYNLQLLMKDVYLKIAESKDSKKCIWGLQHENDEYWDVLEYGIEGFWTRISDKIINHLEPKGFKAYRTSDHRTSMVIEW